MEFGKKENAGSFHFPFVLAFLHLFFFFLVCNSFLFPQNPSIDSLAALRLAVINANHDEKRSKANDEFIVELEKILASEESYKMSFDSLRQTGVLYSPDRVFRMITWNLPFDEGTHKYFCYIQTRSRKKNFYMVYKLDDKSEELKSPEYKSLGKEKWFGSLYYQIIPFSHKGKTYYTLLGWDGNNTMTRKKVIDVLTFSGNGEPRFGDDIFFMGKNRKKRVIFEYSSHAVMSLKFHSERKQIVFDHLSPSQPELEGLFQYYGPDFSYDAFEWDKGKWVFKEDINIKSDAANPVYSPENENREKKIYEPKD